MSKLAIQAAMAAAILLAGLVLGLAMAPDTEELEAQVAALQGEVQGRASAADLAALEGQLGSLGGEVESLAAKLDSLADAPKPGAARLDGLEASVEDLTGLFDARLGVLEARLSGIAVPAATALRGEVEDLAGRLAALESSHAAMHGAKAEAAEMKAAEPKRAAAEVAEPTRATVETAARPAGLDAPGVHALGVGVAVWLVEKEVSMALSRIEPGKAALVYVNGTPITLPLGREVRLRGLDGKQGPCRATLKHVEAGTAFVQASCG